VKARRLVRGLAVDADLFPLVEAAHDGRHASELARPSFGTLRGSRRPTNCRATEARPQFQLSRALDDGRERQSKKIEVSELLTPEHLPIGLPQTPEAQTFKRHRSAATEPAFI
jgi:hypothetical protein